MQGTWVGYCDHGLAGVSVITTGCSVVALATGLGAPQCIAMGGIRLAMGIDQTGLRKASKRLGEKAQEHEKMRLLT